MPILAPEHPQHTTPVATCTNTACLAAISHFSLCECTECEGADHGGDHREGRAKAVAAMQARYVRPGFTAAMLAATDDEGAF